MIYVDHPEDDSGFFDGLKSAVDADFLNLVGCLADAGGVDEAEGDAVDVDGVFDGVARGAVNVADDGTVVSQKTVE